MWDFQKEVRCFHLKSLDTTRRVFSRPALANALVCWVVMEVAGDYYFYSPLPKLHPLDEDLYLLDSFEASPKDLLPELDKVSANYEAPMESLELEQSPPKRAKTLFTLVRMPDCAICMEQFEESFKLMHSCKFVCCKEVWVNSTCTNVTSSVWSAVPEVTNY